MSKNENVLPLSPIPEVNDMLTETIRQGAERLLSTAIEAEVVERLSRYEHIRDAEGHRQVVRNGYLPSRSIQTGIGAIPIKAPRIRNNSDEEVSLHSVLLPPYLKRTKSMEELVPWLYLKGISTGDMNSALKALLGEHAKGLSAKNIGHLTAAWQQEYEQWERRDLSKLRIVYVWADGVYLKARMDNKQCLLVLIGADDLGKKHVLAISSGERESTLSWKELLLDLKGRGLNIDFKLGVGDGAMGFWSALCEVCPGTKQQRCWVHKTMNILNKLPKLLHSKAKDCLHNIWMAPRREDAEKSFDEFVAVYSDKYPKATACLSKDRDALLCFYDFPAQHWHHIRTSNPIESMFATIKLRTAKTRGCLSRKTGLAMVFKLAMAAETKWPKLRGSALVADVIRGVKFKDGEKKNQENLVCAA